jgi:hypothetical protein
MANEKYLNYYIEIMTSTLTECVIRNISMQANAKITDGVVKEQSEKIDALININNKLKENIEELKENNASIENNAVLDLKNKLLESEKLVTKLGNDINESNSKHRTEIDELTSKFRDYDSVKNQAVHVETFKGELVRAREETNQVRSELESRINALASENTGKINALIEQNDRTVKELIQKHETEKSEYNNKIDELIAKIDYLQLPPAKRKKIDELNKEVIPTTTLPGLSGIDGPIKDGGTF